MGKSIQPLCKRMEATCVTTVTALAHTEPAAFRAHGTLLAEQNQAWLDGLCSGRTRQPSAWRQGIKGYAVLLQGAFLNMQHSCPG